MADLKISALPASTVPLAGTEVLPIVQSSTTKQVSVANLTAGRSFDALGMTLTSTDAGATAAPLLELYRDSASPAAADTLGEIEFNGEDSAGNKQAYALFHGSILSPTSGAEQGQLHFETATAGALTEKMIIGTTNLVINEIGAVFNVRIEGDTDANLFFTDATNSRIGIGTISPAHKLDLVGTLGVSSTTTLSGLTASTALALNASKEIVSVTNTGTGDNVLATSPTFSGNVRLGSKTMPTATGGQIQLIGDCLIFAGDTTIPSPYTQNLQIDITWGNWGANPAFGLVEVAVAAREFGGNSGGAFGWLYALNAGGATFTSFTTTGVTTVNSAITAASGGNYILRITFNPTSDTDIIGYTIRIPSMRGGTGSSVSNISATLV